MLQSMTAYGQAHAQSEHHRYAWELRSVNQRHLGVILRLPESLRQIESAVRDKIGRKVKRGKLDASLELLKLSDSVHTLALDKKMLVQLSAAIDEVKSARNDIAPVDPLELLQWPGLLLEQSPSEDIQIALDSFDRALDDFLQSRAREGGQIETMLSTRLHELKSLLTQLQSRRAEVVQSQKQKLTARLSALEVTADSGRLEQELVFMAQRLDIDEELDRLGAHVNEFAHALEREEPVGRRLDFLLQEFNREANTIASKASDSETTAISVDMKVIIEQMREQVQNVE